MPMTLWIEEFPPSAQSGIVKRIKASILRLHARIFELLLPTPWGEEEESDEEGEEEEVEENEEEVEEEVAPVRKGKGRMRATEVEVEEPGVVLNDPPVRFSRFT
jgi:hypothetical protein